MDEHAPEHVPVEGLRAVPAEAAIGPLIYWNRDYRGIKDLS